MPAGVCHLSGVCAERTAGIVLARLSKRDLQKLVWTRHSYSGKGFALPFCHFGEIINSGRLVDKWLQLLYLEIRISCCTQQTRLWIHWLGSFGWISCKLWSVQILSPGEDARGKDKVQAQGIHSRRWWHYFKNSICADDFCRTCILPVRQIKMQLCQKKVWNQPERAGWTDWAACIHPFLGLFIFERVHSINPWNIRLKMQFTAC